MKESRTPHKKVPTMWFHLYETLEKLIWGWGLGAGMHVGVGGRSCREARRNFGECCNCLLSWLWWFHGCLQLSKHQVVDFKYRHLIICQVYINKESSKQKENKTKIRKEGCMWGGEINWHKTLRTRQQSGGSCRHAGSSVSEWCCLGFALLPFWTWAFRKWTPVGCRKALCPYMMVEDTSLSSAHPLLHAWNNFRYL